MRGLKRNQSEEFLHGLPYVGTPVRHESGVSLTLYSFYIKTFLVFILSVVFRQVRRRKHLLRMRT